MRGLNVNKSRPLSRPTTSLLSGARTWTRVQKEIITNFKRAVLKRNDRFFLALAFWVAGRVDPNLSQLKNNNRVAAEFSQMLEIHGNRFKWTNKIRTIIILLSIVLMKVISISSFMKCRLIGYGFKLRLHLTAFSKSKFLTIDFCVE